MGGAGQGCEVWLRSAAWNLPSSGGQTQLNRCTGRFGKKCQGYVPLLQCLQKGIPPGAGAPDIPIHLANISDAF